MGKVAYINRWILMDNLHIPSSGSTVRRSLLEAYVSMGQTLILRNLETDGVSFVGEFHDMSPNPAYPGLM